jgi:hypothetical protein
VNTGNKSRELSYQAMKRIPIKRKDRAELNNPAIVTKNLPGDTVVFAVVAGAIPAQTLI